MTVGSRVKSKTVATALIAIGAVAIVVGMVVSGAGFTAQQPREKVRVATTTSLYDTGLWEYLEPMFKEKYDVELDLIYAGTGIALECGRRGDVDAVVIHDKAREEEFVAQGYGIERIPFAYNQFLIVGPADDPAGIKGLSPEDAFRKIMEEATSNPGRIRFVSRGDESGTHVKERTIWQAAGIDYKTVEQGADWYVQAGRKGMGPTLVMASEMNAYTLTDVATFLTYKGKLDLVPLVDKGQILLNVYSVIAVNAEKHPHVNIKMANNLVQFLVSPEIQKLIGEYGVEEYGVQLFTPCAGAEPEQ